MSMCFLDSMEVVLKSVAGNVAKFQNFPKDLEWADKMWRKTSKRSQPYRLRLEPEGMQRHGLRSSHKILNRLLGSACFRHQRWKKMYKIIQNLESCIDSKVKELQKAQIRTKKNHQLSGAQKVPETNTRILKVNSNMDAMSQQVWDGGLKDLGEDLPLLGLRCASCTLCCNDTQIMLYGIHT